MQTIQFKVDNSYIEIVMNVLNSLNSLKLNLIQDLSVVNQDISNVEIDETKDINAFSNHTANLIEEWKDEDEIWI